GGRFVDADLSAGLKLCTGGMARGEKHDQKRIAGQRRFCAAPVLRQPLPAERDTGQIAIRLDPHKALTMQDA
ncbi:MAG: hypothetical protein ACK4WC_13020, partial [Rubrimonas sp.]